MILCCVDGLIFGQNVITIRPLNKWQWAVLGSGHRGSLAGLDGDTGEFN